MRMRLELRPQRHDWRAWARGGGGAAYNVAVAQGEHHAQLVDVHLALVDAVDLLVLRRTVKRREQCCGVHAAAAALTFRLKHSTRLSTYLQRDEMRCAVAGGGAGDGRRRRGGRHQAPSFLPLTMLSLAACSESHAHAGTRGVQAHRRRHNVFLMLVFLQHALGGGSRWTNRVPSHTVVCLFKSPQRRKTNTEGGVS
jgi:hypothetical protein